MNYEIINKRKKELGLTNAAISEITGITISTLDKITSGANQNPKLDTLQSIADAIGCTLDDFVESSQKSTLSPEALDLARKYDAIGDEHSRGLIRTVIEYEYEHHARTNTLPTSEWLLAHAINAPDAEDQAHSG